MKVEKSLEEQKSNVRGYYCNSCHSLRYDPEKNEFGYYICLDCGMVLEECDGTC